MNWKTVVIGGIVFYVVTFIVSMATGPIVHEGILETLYIANESFWRPELTQDPPDMAALMPRWIAVGLISSLVLAAIYGYVQSAFSGPGWKRGLLFGLGVSIIFCLFAAGYSGVFNLPEKIWAVWSLESFAYYLPGGAALGWVVGKLGS
jgi:hypothetical protein